jgi:hypothetical protein
MRHAHHRSDGAQQRSGKFSLHRSTRRLGGGVRILLSWAAS